MNFFEEQERARGQSRKLFVLFFVAVVGVIGATNLALSLFVKFHCFDGDCFGSLEPWKLYTTVTAFLLFTIVIQVVLHFLPLRRGGRAVPEQMAANLVPRASADEGERRLLNIVEEMAIAAGLPVPATYVLSRDLGINAFAAGFSHRDSVICVTRGCLEKLTREELQGVVAHEFSHIFHLDTRINLLTAGAIGGLTFITEMGRGLLNATFSSSRRRRDSSVDLLGIVLVVVGSVGVFFARFVKAAISREREFLADASAVRFTRNSAGIGMALVKIHHDVSTVSGAAIETYGHLFFAMPLGGRFSGWLATHPPIAERVSRIDRDLVARLSDRSIAAKLDIKVDYRHEKWPDEDRPISVSPEMKLAMLGTMLDGAGTIPAAATNYAQTVLQEIKPETKTETADPKGAQATLLALVLAQLQSFPESAFARLDAFDPDVGARARKLVETFFATPNPHRIVTAELAIATLRDRLSADEKRAFVVLLSETSFADHHLSLFEVCLGLLVEQALVGPRRPPRPKHSQAPQLKRELHVLLRFLVAMQRGGIDTSKAFLDAWIGLGFEPSEAPVGPATFSPAVFRAALVACAEATPHLKARILKACVRCIQADGEISPLEKDLFRAIGTVFRTPIPILA